jgi:outer membrane protein OmpA-like peptidoglycan-associated protein
MRSLPLCVAALALTAGIFSSRCLAQDPTAEAANSDAPGCADPIEFSRLPVTVISSCEKANSIELDVPLAPDPQGNSHDTMVRGAYEFIQYKILETGEQETAFDSLSQLLVIKGFSVEYVSNPTMITARNQDTWIIVEVEGDYYEVKIVRSVPESWTFPRNAEEISRAMQMNGHVAIYGIQFSSDNQNLSEVNSPILSELLAYLKANPGRTVDVESHKWSQNGTAESDQQCTAMRSVALSVWLVAHGVAKQRLHPQGLGRTKPLTGNDTFIGAERNERIELVAVSQ